MRTHVNTDEAALIMGVAHNTVRNHAKKAGWEIKKVQRRGPASFEYRLSDVLGYKDEIKQRAIDKDVATVEQCQRTRDLVEWADNLTAWPSPEELFSMASDRYHVKDLIGLIENRIYRGVNALDLEEY